MLLVDTNILEDVFENDPDWVNWSVARLREQSSLRTLDINPVISESAFTFSTIEKLDAVISGLKLAYKEIRRPALFLQERHLPNTSGEAAKKPMCCQILSSARLRRYLAVHS